MHVVHIAAHCTVIKMEWIACHRIVKATRSTGMMFLTSKTLCSMTAFIRMGHHPTICSHNRCVILFNRFFMIIHLNKSKSQHFCTCASIPFACNVIHASTFLRMRLSSFLYFAILSWISVNSNFFFNVVLCNRNAKSLVHIMYFWYFMEFYQWSAVLVEALITLMKIKTCTTGTRHLILYGIYPVNINNTMR